MADIRKPEVLEKLVQALALQGGSEVNYSELAQIINVDKNTISKYIEILQKGYIIFKLGKTVFSGTLFFLHFYFKIMIKITHFNLFLNQKTKNSKKKSGNFKSAANDV